MLLVATILHSYVGKPSARKKTKKIIQTQFLNTLLGEVSSLDALEVITRCAQRVVRSSRSFSFLVKTFILFFIIFDAAEGSLIINQPKRQKVFKVYFRLSRDTEIENQRGKRKIVSCTFPPFKNGGVKNLRTFFWRKPSVAKQSSASL